MSEPPKPLRLNLWRDVAIVLLVAVASSVFLAAACRHAFSRGLPAERLIEEAVRSVGYSFTRMAVVQGVVGVLFALMAATLVARMMTERIRRFCESILRENTEEPLMPADDGTTGCGSLEGILNEVAQTFRESRQVLETEVQSRTGELLALNRVLACEVAQRTRAEQDLRESLSVLQATLESTADGILVTDEAGRIKSFNRPFRDLWQIPDAVLEQGRNDQVLSVASSRLKDPEGFLTGIRELHDRPNLEDFDIVEFTDGRVVERYSKAQIIDGRIVGRVWSFRDVTERHRAQQKQAALLRKVAEINEELTHFAYVVSHDLKAPLRGIRLITEWLCADYADTLGDDAREQLALLQNRVQRMHNLIDGVLQYSRIGRIKEEMKPVDLNELLPGIVDTIAAPAHVHITVDGGLPTLECEKTRIVQVFQNLLTNAVKYMDKPVGEIRVGGVAEGDFWKFSVADNGPGIEERHFDRIFRIFQTLAPRDEFESTGIGLTLVRKIVEMYGGRVWVRSEVGRGSTFFFTLPRHKTTTEEE